MIRYTAISFLILLYTESAISQKIEKIEIPKGVLYNYCKTKTYENSKSNIRMCLKEADNYSLLDKMMFVGPVLWARFQKIESLNAIEGGNTTLLVNNRKLSAKLTQDIEDSKK